MSELAPVPPREGSSDPLADLRAITIEAGYPELALQIDTVSSRLAAGTLRIGLLGQFKRGKSTLLNAILGQDVLPTGVLPLTSCPTEVQEGPVGGRVHLQGGSVEPLRLEQLGNWMTRSAGDPRAGGVERLEVTLPLPGWARGLTWLDTPGVGSLDGSGDRVALAVLPTVDVAIFVLSPDPPITEAERKFLRAGRDYASRFFFVMNKADTLDAAGLQQVLQYTEAALVERCGFESPQIFAVSARESLRRGGAPEPTNDAHWTRFLDSLRRTVSERRQETVRASIRRRTLGFAETVHRAIALSLLAAEAEAGRFAAAVQVLEAAVGRLEEERRAADAILNSDASELIRQLGVRLDDFRRRTTDEVLPLLQRALAESPGRAGGAVVRAYDASLRALLLPRVAALRVELAELSAEVLASAFARYGQRLGTVLGEIRARTDETLRVTLVADAAPTPFEASSEYYPRVDALLEGSLAAQTTLLLPAAYHRWSLRQRLPRLVDREVDGQCGRLRDDLIDRMSGTIAAFRRAWVEQLALDTQAIQTGLRAGTSQRSTDAPSREAWELGQRKLLARLESLERTVAEWVAQ